MSSAVIQYDGSSAGTIIIARAEPGGGAVRQHLHKHVINKLPSDIQAVVFLFCISSLLRKIVCVSSLMWKQLPESVSMLFRWLVQQDVNSNINA